MNFDETAHQVELDHSMTEMLTNELRNGTVKIPAGGVAIFRDQIV